MPASTATRNTIATRNTMVSERLTMEAMISAKTRWTGARTHMRSIIWNAFCRLVTSVVIRVTRPAVEYLSMLENEKCWMFSYIASRRLPAKPVDAVAANLPASTPSSRAMAATRKVSRPYLTTAFISPFSIPWSMIKAMMVGSSTSMMASRAEKIGVRIAARLYSPRCDTSFLIICCNPPEVYLQGSFQPLAQLVQ